MYKENHLEDRIADLKWAKKVRSKPILDKLEDVLTHCPCCVSRIVKSTWLMSDQELQEKINVLEKELLAQIDIDDAL